MQGTLGPPTGFLTLRGKWLASVLRGHDNYYGVPFNDASLARFHRATIRLWYRTLRRRSQRSTVTWTQVQRYAARWLPLPRSRHPYPAQRLHV